VTELLHGETGLDGQAPAPAPAPPERGSATSTLRWAWRTLTSMRTALLLLLLLALASIPGSVLPQRGTAPGDVIRFEQANPTLAPVLDRLWLFEVFSAPWFAAIYLLLLIAMTGCVVPRCRRLWRAVRAQPAAAPSKWDRLDAQVQGTYDLAAEEVLDRAASELRRRGFRVRPAATSAVGTVSAEKGYSREVGNLVFHSSLLLLLYGVAFGHLYGFEGRVIVVEGAGFSNVRAQYDEFKGGPGVDPDRLEPFAFTLQDFRASFERDGVNRGAPRQFAADVTVTSGREPERLTLEVNQPLEVNGTKAFLTGHGYAPVFTVRDGNGDTAFQGPVVFLPRDASFASEGVIKAPDATPTQLAFEGFFLPTAAIGPQGPMSSFPAAQNPQALLTAYTGDLNLGNGVPQSVYSLDKSLLRQVEVDGAPLARALEVGQTMTLPDGQGSITLDGVQQFANFQLAHDPGRQTSLVAAVLLLAGLTGSLVIRQRRIFVRVTDGEAGITSVAVGGLARTRRGLPDGELDDIGRALGLEPDDAPGQDGRVPKHDDTPGGQRA
jgi:cytochrome c biogenesis protein